MIIDFDSLDSNTAENVKGGKGPLVSRCYADGLNRITLGTVPPHSSLGLHTHTDSSEIIYAIKGKARLMYDGNEEELRAGQCHYCPKGHSHSVVNDSEDDFRFFGVIPRQ